MNSYILKEINLETFESLNRRIDELQGDWVVYVDSIWWDVTYWYAILDRLNSISDKINLKLIAWYSMWFTIFNEFKWKKSLMKYCDAVIHAIADNQNVFKYKWKIQIREEKVVTQQIELVEYEPLDILTDEENDMVGNGWSIYLDYKKLINLWFSPAD